MPQLEIYDLHQTAVYWEYDSVDIFGEPITLPPVEILCRWIDGQQEMQDPMGNKVMVQATVVVAQDIVPKSIMRLGTLADFIGTGSVIDDDVICYVQLVNKVPSLDARYFYRSVGLLKYGGKRPIVE
jgi:hypothetical protein